MGNVHMMVNRDPILREMRAYGIDKKNTPATSMSAKPAATAATPAAKKSVNAEAMELAEARCAADPTLTYSHELKRAAAEVTELRSASFNVSMASKPGTPATQSFAAACTELAESYVRAEPDLPYAAALKRASSELYALGRG